MARLAVLVVLALLAASAQAHRDLPAFERPFGGPSDACQMCLTSVRIVEDLLCDPAATDFLVDFVETRVCPAMGDVHKCENLAEGLLPMLIQWFRGTATPALLCADAGVCGAAVLQDARLNRPAARAMPSTGAECAMCKFVVRRIKTALNDSDAMEKVKEEALKVCNDLPNELAGSCSDFVDTYEPVIADLVEDMDPDYVCSLMGVCFDEMFGGVRLPPMPAQLVRALGSLRALRTPPPPPHPFLPGGLAGLFGPPANDGCDYCKMAVIEAHSLIANPDVQAQVLNYTKTICQSFTGFADTCQEYVDVYAPLVFSLLEEYLVPDTLCAQIGMCPPAGMAFMPLVPLDGPAPTDPHGGGHGGFLGWLHHLLSRVMGGCSHHGGPKPAEQQVWDRGVVMPMPAVLLADDAGESVAEAVPVPRGGYDDDAVWVQLSEQEQQQEVRQQEEEEMPVVMLEAHRQQQHARA